MFDPLYKHCFLALSIFTITKTCSLRVHIAYVGSEVVTKFTNCRCPVYDSKEEAAVKTAETGYMSRRLMKGLEDLSVFYDQTVRNASGGIVQFAYGDDGMDPAKMEGRDGTPLNLDQLLMKVMATCPQRG
uniref:DNA-directed RNA polymerase n=1 Tax=Arundo donax TaxID=35708 RepID=A0A0A9CI33_ARUDO